MTLKSISFFGMAMILAMCGQGSALAADEKTTPKWEYRVVSKDQVIELGKNDLAAGLNKLGSDGWELVVVDGGYIFKRPKPQNDKEIADLKLRIAVLNRDIEMQKERVAWCNRMFKMGYLSGQIAAAEQERLERFGLVLERMNKDLDKLSVPPTEPIPVAPQPRERK
jgi:hypothetical protein